MPPRPFPYPFSVGLDICSIQRVQSLLQRSRPSQHLAPAESSLPQLRPFLARLFSFREILLFNQRFKGVLHEPAADRHPALVAGVVSYLAARFAAKEAVVKAVSPRRIFLKDVLVVSQGNQPYAIVLDESPVLTHVQRLYLNRTFGFSLPLSKEIDPDVDLEGHPDLDPALERCKGQEAKLSISHDGGYAGAVCLAVEQAEPNRLLGVLREYRAVLAEIRAITAQMQSSTSKLTSAYNSWRKRLFSEHVKRKKAVARTWNLVRQRVATIRMYNDALNSLVYIIFDKNGDAVSQNEPGSKERRPAYLTDPSALYKSIMGGGRVQILSTLPEK